MVQVDRYVRRPYIAYCPVCGREYHFKSNDPNSVKCIDCFVPLKMPPVAATTERQDEITHLNYSEERRICQ